MTARRASSWKWIAVLAVAMVKVTLPAVGSNPLRVAVAANFAAPVAELAERFQAQTGQAVSIVSGSTGKHYAQIVNGAPFDVFLAADRVRPEALEDSAIAVAGSRFTYALGRLVLWSPDPEVVSSGGEVLSSGRFGRLAMANPRLAPYGRAAGELLALRGLTGRLAGRIVQGENIAQAFQFVATGNAELGFVALSQLRSAPAGLEGSHWLVPTELHEPIEQQAVLLVDSPAARRFLDFVASESGRALIRSYGYETP